MKPHVEQTISDAVAMIARLQDMIGLLRSMGTEGPWPSLPVNYTPLERAKPVPMQIAVSRLPASTHRPARPGSREVYLPAIKGLKEPFTNGDIQGATGLNYKNVSNLVQAWLRKGWIQKTAGAGQYTRTRNYGGVHAQNEDLHRQIRSEIDGAKQESD